MNIVSFSFSQRGKDGNKIVTGNTILNEYTYLNTSAPTGTTIVSVQNTNLNSNGRFSGNLEPGDLLFIYNIQGVEIKGEVDPLQANAAVPNDLTWGEILDYRNVGLYEFAEVKNILSPTQIELTCGLKYNHTLGNFNEKVMVVRVPRYNQLTINAGGTITCDSWNGQIGGVVVIEVLGNTIINGQINVSEKGFRGGALNVNSSNYEWHFTGSDNTFGGWKGEGIAGYETEYNIFGGGYGMAAPANGGGAGNSHNGGGAGGANTSTVGLAWTGKGIPSTTNASWANAWNIEQAGLAGSQSAGGGRGGYCLSLNNGDALTEPPGNAVWGGHNRANFGGLGGRPLDYSTGRIFMGGGGGSGHQNNGEGGGGGNAGGLVFLTTHGDISGSGSILADGKAGTGSEGRPGPFGGQANKDGSGGGGAGGTIIVKATGNINTITTFSRGGNGGNQVITAGLFGGSIVEAEGPGGGGGGGYIGTSNVITTTIQGGTNGTTNSPSLSEFPPNGATQGAIGLTNTIDNNYHFYAENDTICGGGIAVISPTIIGNLPTGSGQLEWYDSYFSTTLLHTGNTFTTPVLTTTTTYYFGGCNIPFRDSVTITVSPAIIIDTNAMVVQHEKCTGNNGSITGITVSGGLGNLSYFWNNNPASNLDTTNLSGNTFELIVFDSVGCSDTIANIVVNSSRGPSIDTNNLTIIQDSCLAGTGEFTGIVISGGSGNFSYTLNGNTVTDLNTSNLDSGRYELVVIDNIYSCSDTVLLHIPPILPPQPYLGNDTTLCTGNTLLLDASTTGATYSWQDGNTNSTYTVSTPGIYWVDVFLNGCSTRDSITITYTNGTPVNLGNDTTLCESQTLSLDVTRPGATYTWQDGNTNPTYTVTTTGEYHVVINEAGCINRDTIQITYQQVQINLGNDTSLCDVATLSLNATKAGATYIWQDGNTNPTYTVTSAGSYWVDITIGNCINRDSITILYFQSPVINLGNDTLICDDEFIYLNASFPDATYLWNDASTAPIKRVSTAGQYDISVTNSCGTTKDTINILTQNCSCNMFVPNSFTPNKDGFNDIFAPQISCDFELFEFRLFNRYGELMLMSTDEKVIWDGSYKGKNSPTGTYVWSIRYRLTKEIEVKTIFGHVTIIK